MGSINADPDAKSSKVAATLEELIEKSLSGKSSKNVVVLRSKQLKSGMNGSTAPRCNRLRNIVESKIFRTNQESQEVC